MERVGDLVLDQDLRWQRWEWRVQRLAWLLLFAVVVLALAGVFGNGPVSSATARSSDGDIEVDYERFGRRGGSQELKVRAAADAADGGSWQVEISRELLAAVDITSVSPEPDSVAPVGGRLRYTFSQGEPGADLEAIFAVTPRGLWRHRGEVTLGPNSLVVDQFFLP